VAIARAPLIRLRRELGCQSVTQVTAWEVYAI